MDWNRTGPTFSKYLTLSISNISGPGSWFLHVSRNQWVDNSSLPAPVPPARYLGQPSKDDGSENPRLALTNFLADKKTTLRNLSQ